jgi:glucosamine-6-phosphate deaminase
MMAAWHDSARRISTAALSERMNIITVSDPEALAQTGADLFAAAVAAKPDASVVLATGNTPMGVYAELARRRAASRFDASKLRPFQLDGYLNISLSDKRSLYGWLKRSFLDPLGIDVARLTALPDDATNPTAACAQYDRTVDAIGGFDLSVLGLGPNGHLGFNEPPSPPNSPTREVALTEASLRSNAGYWGGIDRVPRRAITCGMRQLLGARQTLLLVSGAHKREILYSMLSGPITPDVPASLLRTVSNVTVIADEAALG